MIRKSERPVGQYAPPSRCLEVGSGQLPVVMLHGLFGSPDNWQPIMEDLADHYRFLAPQLPIDRSEDRRHTSFRSLSQLTDFVEQFLDARGLERVVLCGNSLGGQVALDFYLRCPDRVEKLVLSGSAGLFERNLSGKTPRLSRNLIRENACNIFHDPVHVTDELVEDMYEVLADRQYRRFILRVAKATRNRYMLDDLASVHVPTMIIWGRNDSITPPFVAEQFCDSIPNAQLAFLDACGHAPPIEQPDQFARVLRAFLGATTIDRGRVPRKPK